MNLAYLRVGDVIAHSGAEWVVEMVNDCRARVRCLSRALRTVKDGRHDEVHTFRGSAAMMNISNLIEPEEVLRHDTDLVNATNKQQRANTMSTKEKTTPTKTEKKPENHAGLLGGIFGQSVTSVLRRLGKEGVSTAHAREIMKAQEVETSDITVSIQVNAGRNGKGGPPAELTAAQIKQLVSSAPEPVKAPKKVKPAKKGKDAKKPAAKKDAKPAKKAAAKAPAAKEDDADEEVVDAEE